MRATFYIGGALLEFVGIVLVASPDLFPYAERLSQWATPKFDRIRNWLGRPRRLVYNIPTAVSMELAGRVVAMRGIGDEAPVDDKLRFLLTRDQEAQRDVQELSHRVEDVEKATHARLDALDDKMKRHVGERLDTSHREYLGLRIIGVAFVVAGLVCATVGNFL
jgi:hypothetical protein